MLLALQSPIPVVAQATLSPTGSDALVSKKGSGKEKDLRDEDVLILSPFDVKTERDNTYGALNSNSVSQFNTALDKVPVSADIFTEDFMRDISATTVEELMQGYGAGSGMVMSNPDSDAISQQPGDRVGNQTLGVRGVGAGSIRRDGFTVSGGNSGSTAVGVTSTFDVERADVIRGPQGLLYGAGGAGGTINLVSKRANFSSRKGSASLRFDQYGSAQALLDYNLGTDLVAVRVSLMEDRQRYRREFIGYDTVGLYTQLAFKLVPLRSVLRLQAQTTNNERVNNTNQENIGFTNAATDPRHNFGLSYMLRNNLAGAINPATGQPWPRGAIANGNLTWDNINSWGGWVSSEYLNNKNFSGSLETVWSRWMSTQFNVLYNDTTSDRAGGGVTNISAPLLNGNPLNEWANGGNLSDTEQPTRRWAARGAVMFTGALFDDRMKSQTLFGYDIEWTDSGPTDFIYYLADSNFNVVYNSSIPSNLGRTPMPTQWWSVANGPVEKPLPRSGWTSPRVTFDGVNYVRMARNPRDPSWVGPNNPLGLASLAGLAGVTGQNNDGHHWQQRTAGYYTSNYTSWFNDRFGTLVGIRANETFKRTPNITTTVKTPWAESTSDTVSYNLGVNVALKEWLRVYYSRSSTYNVPLVNANDPLGNPPLTSSGTGQEFGLKFTSRDGRISGSLQYYDTDSKDEMINAGTGVRDLINPTGLNGAHDGPAGSKNQWVNLDRTTKGLELIVTASPTPNWRVRFAATSSDGQNLTDKTYPLLWNDQFNLSNGVVTYQNGAPFLVPVTPSVIVANINTLNRQIDPATLQSQGTWVPLTLAMMNDTAGPYWAQPAPDNGRIQTSNLRRVLQFFVGPNGTALTGKTGLSTADIPYFWSDPNGTDGQTVVAKKGESTVGYSQYRFVLTNNYTFNGDNFLKGFGIGGTLALGLKNRTFYYNAPGGTRFRFESPDTWQANLIASYSRKIGKRYRFTTQVNVENVFNHYRLGTLPNNGSGFTVPANLAVTFYGQPRMYVWTNRLSF